ncbi:LysR family transcriptional regulator [Variovorax sp. H27-G14]|uniref:LysR family transcriptional regulator n=1 Tax=Variovorax sp. H27-G14 TaxID=3111914 RepID=UPI0038FC3DDA
MELRHLRYFVAVAEEGSFTVAAERRLHTAQPSLSRQIRDLEYEVGTPLLSRSARGVELTAAGKAFLDHARLALSQVEAAGEAARRAATPAKTTFALGFLTGQEIDWLAEVMRTLRDELPLIEVTVQSQYSPSLADALLRGKLDLAFMRREPNMPDLAFKLVTREPLLVVLRSDHALAARKSIDPRALAKENFVQVSNTAPALRAVIDSYLKHHRLAITPVHEADNLAMAISLVASTRGVALLPVYALNFLPASVVSRPLKSVGPSKGEAPAIDLVVGYHKANASPLLKLFLSRMDEMVARVAQRAH